MKNDICEVLSCNKCYKVECGICDKQRLKKEIENTAFVPNMEDKEFYTVEKKEWDKMVQGAKQIVREKQEEMLKWKQKAISYYSLAKSTGIYCIVDEEIAQELATENH